jgi:hypothetical protein
MRDARPWASGSSDLTLYQTIADAGETSLHQTVVIEFQFSLPHGRYQFPESLCHSQAKRTAMRLSVKAQ